VRPRGIGLSKLVATSNEADLELADFLDYLAGDDASHVIALYIEAVRNPGRFRAAVLKARRAGKSIVAFKIGRSEAGAQAAVSHTGALAGSDCMYDALFKQLGILRAQTFGDLLDIGAVLATGRKLFGKRVAILTSTGGAGTLVADCLGAAGFATPPPDAETAAALRALQAGSAAALDRNPIDVTLAGLRPELLRGAMRALLASTGYDALAIIVGSTALAMPDLMADAIADCLPLSEKPVIAYVSPHAPEIGAVLTRRGVPAFAAVESCAVALAAMLQAERCSPLPEAQRRIGMKIDIDDFPAGSLDEAQAKRCLPASAFPSLRKRSCPRRRKRKPRQPLSVVAWSSRFFHETSPHKSDVRGVAIDLNIETIGERLRSMREEVAATSGVRPERFLVQQMIVGGTELILGLHREPLGTAVLLGMGGVAAELFKDTTMRLLPPEGGLTRDEALAMARELISWPLLDGFRGRPKADVDALTQAVVAFSRMTAELGERLIEAEINPLFVLPAGQGVRAADGVVILRAV
jgi:acyl-CoA synthetase (NDP forming)